MGFLFDGFLFEIQVARWQQMTGTEGLSVWCLRGFTAPPPNQIRVKKTGPKKITNLVRPSPKKKFHPQLSFQ